ncbi:TetR/AcrR family transcriptional regulator [Cohnella caldifontis]|uniref:TetR/AcrR family transcriptional regulator n=1 Tax=Cohnella caldifontis TaxID=3027471 RepID=UPI0023EB1DB4|nr:TetR/AcrR family transcriptional regulator [Cohnella sp. YIM B05605]
MEPNERPAYFDLQSRPIANATKIKILETAVELFSQRGFSGASVRDITGEVGIKESSLYKHFKSKDEILETIFANFRREADKMLPPTEHLDFIARSMSLTEFLERGIANFLDHMRVPIHRKIWRILYNELFRHPTARRIYRMEILERSVEVMAAVFEKMMQQGKMKPFDARPVAMEYEHASMTLILEYNLRMAENESTEPLERQIREHVRFFSAMTSA